MSSGTQVDLDWAGTDTAQGGAVVPPASAPSAGAAGTAYLTDEEILGIEPVSSLRNENAARTDAQQVGAAEAGEPAEVDAAKSTQAEARATGEMPEWMRTVAADPKNGAEAQQLWREHQEFCAAFSSPEEARAVKELLPGGVKDVLTLRKATQSVDRIDAAIFSGDARAQSEVVAELARANPAAFRSMFAEAAKVLASLEAGGREAVVTETRSTDSLTKAAMQEPRSTDHGTRDTVRGAPQFDPAAYAAFERSTNDAVARDVRGSISDTLARVMPEGVADGAARRIGDDIFNEVHRAMAADPTLSEQVASVLRDRRFGGAEQQRVASLLAGRAKQLVPSVARRVIGEWTSTVLDTARSKAARQSAAASRVDIAAPGGSLDSTPLRQMSPREVNYASMSDEEILGI